MKACLNQHIHTLLLVALICLASCGSPVVSTSLPTSAAATSTPTAVPSPTPGPASPTDAPMPTLMPPTRTPRPTPAPTMTTDEEYAFVSEMLQDNGGCRLPCWWGFTPGETSWETAQTFFLSLGKKIPGSRIDGFTSYGVTFSVPQHQLMIRQAYIVDEEGIIYMISVLTVGLLGYEEEFTEDLDHYMLPQFLATYGQPSQVLFRTYLDPEGLYPFHLLLYYPQQGILVRYIDLAERDGETLRFCPKRPGVTLWLWSPKQRITIADIADTGLEGFPKSELAYFRPLEGVTELSVEQFYQAFVQPDDETCLETPADMW